MCQNVEAAKAEVGAGEGNETETHLLASRNAPINPQRQPLQNSQGHLEGPVLLFSSPLSLVCGEAPRRRDILFAQARNTEITNC